MGMRDLGRNRICKRNKNSIRGRGKGKKNK